MTKLGNRGATTSPTNVFRDDWSPNCNGGQFNGKNQWVRGAGDSYDAGGNQNSIASNSSPGVASSNFAFDGENRMVMSSIGGMGSVSYVYDGQGRRVEKIVGSAKTIFGYDAMGSVAAEVTSEVDPSVEIGRAHV